MKGFIVDKGKSLINFKQSISETYTVHWIVHCTVLYIVNFTVHFMLHDFGLIIVVFNIFNFHLSVYGSERMESNSERGWNLNLRWILRGLGLGYLLALFMPSSYRLSSSPSFPVVQPGTSKLILLSKTGIHISNLLL